MSDHSTAPGIPEVLCNMKSVHVKLPQFHQAILELPYLQCLVSMGNGNRNKKPEGGKSCKKKDTVPSDESLPLLQIEQDRGLEDSTQQDLNDLLVSALFRCYYKTDKAHTGFVEVYRQVHENFSIHGLPENVGWMQMMVLEGMHSSCSSR